MPEFRDHVWALLPGVDSYRCENCNLVASVTAVGIDDGLPACKKRSLDDEFEALLGGELPDAPDDVD